MFTLKRHWLLMLLAVVLTACAPTAPTSLVVFAAASLQKPFTELGRAFEQKQANAALSFNFAGSQQLAQQLTEGAPADVFASANQKQLQVVIDADRIASDAVRVFARNRLVVILPADNPGQINTLADLARPGLKLVLAAREVPVGQYTLEFLDKATQSPEFAPSFKEAVLKNVVSYEESVRGVLSKVALGEADAGVAYASDVSAEDSAQVVQLEIPASLNVIAEYPLARLADSPHVDLAQAFVDFVLSPEGQAVLQNYGFTSP